nr:MAG TPA: hypothetical protein [Caudoviricetes sp.]
MTGQGSYFKPNIEVNHFVGGFPVSNLTITQENKFYK